MKTYFVGATVPVLVRGYTMSCNVALSTCAYHICTLSKNTTSYTHTPQVTSSIDSMTLTYYLFLCTVYIPYSVCFSLGEEMKESTLNSTNQSTGPDHFC
ncbi:hypothetical protein FKM82_008092 [Ascaphus truei]